MRSGRITWFAAVLVLVAGTTTGTSALALPAQAATAGPAAGPIGSGCAQVHDIFYNGGNTPPDVTALSWEVCDGFNGTTANQYKNQSGQIITATCV